MLGNPVKRQRDHDEEDLLEVAEDRLHHIKKPCSLTLRTAPQKPSFIECPPMASRFALSALTPVESSDDDDERGNGRARNPLDPTMDIDLRNQPPSANCHNSYPNPGDPHANGGARQSPIPYSLINASLNISEPATASAYGNGAPATPDTMMYQHPVSTLPGAIWDHQHLPSSVSDQDKSKQAPSDADMADSISRPTSLSPCDGTGPWRADMQTHGSTGVAEKDCRLASSRAASPNKKISFAMGFRADCDKCRRKVPGHYNHIIRG